MPTNRQRRTRNRRQTDIGEAMEQLFTTGIVEPDADCWDLWDRPLVYATWDRVKSKQLFPAAWAIFETEGDVCRFEDFSWIDREGYQQWIAENKVEQY
jgi:hypothetical protein